MAAVPPEPREGAKRSQRAHVDDRSRPALAHAGQNSPHRHERRDHVQVEDGAQVPGIQLLEGDVESLPGVVDQHVDPAEHVTHPRKRGAQPDVVGDVRDQGHGPWQLSRPGRQTIAPPRQQRDASAARRQEPRRRLPDARRRPRHRAGRVLDPRVPSSIWLAGLGSRPTQRSSYPLDHRPRAKGPNPGPLTPWTANCYRILDLLW